MKKEYHKNILDGEKNEALRKIFTGLREIRGAKNSSSLQTFNVLQFFASTKNLAFD